VQLERDWKGQGLAILPVSIKEPRDTVVAWTRKMSLTLPVFLDEEAVAARAWRVSATPTVYLLDRRGRVVGKAVGTKSWTSPAGRALLAALLAS